MDVITKYNVGDVVMCVEDIGDGNFFSIRGLLPISRISIDVTLPKSVRDQKEKNIIIQYGFRRRNTHGGEFYWVKEQNLFTNLKEAPKMLKSLGYSLDCEKESERVKNENDFPHLILKEDDYENYATGNTEDEDRIEYPPF